MAAIDIARRRMAMTAYVTPYQRQSIITRRHDERQQHQRWQQRRISVSACARSAIWRRGGGIAAEHGMATVWH